MGGGLTNESKKERKEKKNKKKKKGKKKYKKQSTSNHQSGTTNRIRYDIELYPNGVICFPDGTMIPRQTEGIVKHPDGRVTVQALRKLLPANEQTEVSTTKSMKSHQPEDDEEYDYGVDDYPDGTALHSDGSKLTTRQG